MKKPLKKFRRIWRFINIVYIILVFLQFVILFFSQVYIYNCWWRCCIKYPNCPISIIISLSPIIPIKIVTRKIYPTALIAIIWSPMRMIHPGR